MAMSPAFRYSLLWIGGALLLVCGALSTLGAAYFDGHYLPSNADAFYHARRILDSVMTGAPVIQFDPRIHAPEGSWLTWPWGFDTLLARITALFGPFADEDHANAVLMNLPVAAAPAAIALLLVLTRDLRLSTPLAAIACAAFALFPANFFLYGVGNVDHHFAEQLWLMMTLCASAWFFEARERLAPGIVLGIVLGTAVAIQNGLFILQLAVLIPYATGWLRRAPLPERRATLAFAASLIAVTLLCCVPSQPWRHGFFEFYTLSWFHLYIAVCSGGIVVLMRWYGFERRTLLIVTGVALVAGAPILGTVLMASRFVSGELESVQGIIEAMSPYRIWFVYGPDWSTKYNSWLMWIAMPAWLLNAWWLLRTSDARLRAFAGGAVLFLALYQLQYRFGAMGVTALILTPLVALQQFIDHRPGRARLAALGAALLLVVALVPTASAWHTKWSKGGDAEYEKVRGLFPALDARCREQPGIALAQLDDGHWITYHTRCAVIGDVFLLTPLHARKRHETEALMRLTPEELRRQRPDIRYVVVHHNVQIAAPAGPGLPERPDVETVRPGIPALMRDLLAPGDQFPPGFELLSEATTPAGRPYARAFAIHRLPSGSP